VAKSSCRCYLLDPFGALFEPSPGCNQTCLLDILGGRGPCLAGEHPRKVARAHRNSIGHFLHRQITGQMLENPRLKITDWARIFCLVQEIAAELGLSAGPTQEHDQVLRHIARQGEAMVVFDDGQGEIKTGADACRSPDRSVLYIDRTFFDFHLGRARLQHIQHPPMRSSSATIKQAALSQEKSSSTDGNDATYPGSRASNPIRDPCPFLFGL